MAEAASVCLDKAKHLSPANLEMHGQLVGNHALVRLTVTRNMRAAHNDPHKRSESGAEAVALLVIHAHSPYHVARRSAQGSSYDFNMVPSTARFFQNAARLEVSGTLQSKYFAGRIKKKFDQIAASDHEKTPAYVVIVDFQTPRCYMHHYVPPAPAPTFP